MFILDEFRYNKEEKYLNYELIKSKCMKTKVSSINSYIMKIDYFINDYENWILLIFFYANAVSEKKLIEFKATSVIPAQFKSWLSNFFNQSEEKFFSRSVS